MDWRESGKYHRVFHHTCQIAVRHGLYRWSQENAWLGDANLAANVHSNKVTVAREDLDADPVGTEFGDGFRRCGLGWVQEGKEPEQREIVLIADRVDTVRGAMLGADSSDGQHAESLAVETAYEFEGGCTLSVVQGRLCVFNRDSGAQPDNLFDGALADEQIRLAVGHDNGHALARKVEGNLVHFAVFGFIDQFAGFVEVSQDGNVHEILQSGLIVAVQESHIQDVAVLIPKDVHVSFQLDVPLRDGASLVRAQDVHGPEILNGVQTLDDDFLV